MKKKGIKRIFISFTLLVAYSLWHKLRIMMTYMMIILKRKVKKLAVVQPAPPEINNYEVPVSSEPKVN
ncbi:MAG: hypothetical protein IPO64_11895 [Bacteroidetes bacterium]|nr:hypothetical protein [Bacteroidota bacterium]